jgi:hypothetical protein
MAKISQLPAASSTDYVDGTVFPITSGNDATTKKASLQGLADYYFCGIKCASLTIPSADVLQLNSTPLTIVPAVAGKAISVIDFSRSVDYGTTPYATNTHLQIKTAGADVGQVQQSNSLAATTSSHWNDFDRVTPTAGQTQLLANADLQVFVPTGDPTAGDSDIEVFVLYREI